MEEEFATNPSEFARIPKRVALLSAITVTCILLYFASYYSNNGMFLPSLGFSSLYRMNATSSSSNSYDDHPVHDHEYDELRKVLKAASTKEKTVILTTLNEAWSAPNSIYDIFLESFKLGINTARLLNHLVVIAVDEKAYGRCQESSTVSHNHCYFFKSNKSRDMAREARFMSPIYMEMMWERLELLHTILTLGYNFVFTDTDVMWFRDPFPYFYSNVDFQTSCDRFNWRPFDLNNLPNNGFNFIRSNERTIKFYKYWVSSRLKYPGLHEQDVFNNIKRGPFIKQIRLKLRFLDTDHFGGFCSRSRDFNKVCTMHANCCVGLDRKIADLNTMLEDWKRFVSLSSNQTVLQRPYWRVPDKCHM